MALLVGLLALRYLVPADLALYRDVRNLVETGFVGEVDRREMLDDALGALVENLDPYSRYYPTHALEALSRETGGVYTGIGALFRRPNSDGRVLLALPGSPADRAGLGVGDRVVSVDGVQVAEMEPSGFEQSLRVGPDHTLRLQVEARKGGLRELRITPEEVLEPSIRHSELIDPELGLGYVSILSFTRRTPSEFDDALTELKSRGLRGLVLDLRGNPGGVLGSAVTLANRFVDEGLIVATRNRGPDQNAMAEPSEASWHGLPLVVLVDDASASASEVVAGALQDHRAAVLVGTRTYGKAAVQSLNRFEERQAVLKLTSGYYTTPSGRLIDRGVLGEAQAGIVPDVVVTISESEQSRIHAYLQTMGAPAALLPELRAWEADEGLSLVPEHPSDVQLETALGLLRGKRPGPRPSNVALLADAAGRARAPGAPR